MAIQKTEAIVLKTQPFRTSSLIVTFFTRDFGKIRGLAKGVRKEGELRSAAFELFTKLDLVYYEKMRSDLHLISEFMILESHPGLHNRLDTVAYASYFVDLVDHVCEIQDPHENVFELLEFAFRYLPSISPERLSRLFEIKILAELGWLPYLDACLICQKPLDSGFFSPRQGALLCSNCQRKYSDSRPLSAESVAIMRYYTQHELNDSLKKHMSPATEIELAKVMEGFLLERIDRPIKARQFLHKIKAYL